MKSSFRNWSDVRVFLAVYEEGSTLAASRLLGVAQPTVARRIEVLEHEIGLTLFERDTRGFKPTEAARALYPLAEAVGDSVADFANSARKHSRPRPIRITSPSNFSERNMGIFSEFTAAHPDVEIEFVPSIRFLNLIEGEADVAFRVSSSEPDERLICRRIGTSNYALYGAPSYADQFGLPKSLDALEGHRFVTFRHDDVPDILHDWLLRHVAADQIIKSFSDIEQMYSSIRTGHGLGLAHTDWADREPSLLRCSENIEELGRPLMMLISPDAYRRREVRAFTKFFAPRYAANFR